MRKENPIIISFNYDLIPEYLLSERGHISKNLYVNMERSLEHRIVKPHGSLNWFDKKGKIRIKSDRHGVLLKNDDSTVFYFKKFRKIKSSKREYIPLITPPTSTKRFDNVVFKQNWRAAVSAISAAREVRFIGYSLADADYHARFIFRCGFHNQIEGEIQPGGKRGRPSAAARVLIVDPSYESAARIREVVGGGCSHLAMTVSSWLDSGAVGASRVGSSVRNRIHLDDRLLP